MAKLVSLSIEETSGVDHPAHLREGWMVMKSESGADVDGVLDKIKAAAVGQPNDLEAQMPEENIEVVVEESTDELAKANDRIAELEAMLAATTVEEAPAAVDIEEHLLKSVPENVRKMIDTARAETAQALAKAAETETLLRKELDAAADKDAIAKAAEWTSLSLDPASVGPALRRLAGIDEALCKSVEEALNSANAQAESAGIFAEIGKSNRPDGGDAYEALSALAKSAVEAGNSTTFEQAFVKVAEQNPDLYNRHLSEKGA